MSLRRPTFKNLCLIDCELSKKPRLAILIKTERLRKCYVGLRHCSEVARLRDIMLADYFAYHGAAPSLLRSRRHLKLTIDHDTVQCAAGLIKNMLHQFCFKLLKLVDLGSLRDLSGLHGSFLYANRSQLTIKLFLTHRSHIELLGELGLLRVDLMHLLVLSSIAALGPEHSRRGRTQYFLLLRFLLLGRHCSECAVTSGDLGGSGIVSRPVFQVDDQHLSVVFLANFV